MAKFKKLVKLKKMLNVKKRSVKK